MLAIVLVRSSTCGLRVSVGEQGFAFGAPRYRGGVLVGNDVLERATWGFGCLVDLGLTELFVCMQVEVCFRVLGVGHVGDALVVCWQEMQGSGSCVSSCGGSFAGTAAFGESRGVRNRVFFGEAIRRS